jgi:hypothetical protein
LPTLTASGTAASGMVELQPVGTLGDLARKSLHKQSFWQVSGPKVNATPQV